MKREFEADEVLESVHYLDMIGEVGVGASERVISTRQARSVNPSEIFAQEMTEPA